MATASTPERRIITLSIDDIYDLVHTLWANIAEVPDPDGSGDDWEDQKHLLTDNALALAKVCHAVDAAEGAQYEWQHARPDKRGAFMPTLDEVSPEALGIAADSYESLTYGYVSAIAAVSVPSEPKAKAEAFGRLHDLAINLAVVAYEAQREAQANVPFEMPDTFAGMLRSAGWVPASEKVARA
jgi:hypothetical protein